MAATAELQVPVKDSRTGKDVGETSLNEEIFGITPNVGVMHQVVTAQLAAKRQGTHSTLTRSEVRGGGAKPWRQKGTGRARHGSIRSPQWRGGGVAHGPKPRSYKQSTPKKMVRLALYSALSDRASNEDVMVVNDLDFEAPKTKEALKRLQALGVDGRVLVVLPRGEEHRNCWLSFQNLQQVHLLFADQLNCHDVLLNDKVLFTLNSLPGLDGAEVELEAETETEEAAEAADEAEAETEADEPADAEAAEATDAADPAEAADDTEEETS